MTDLVLATLDHLDQGVAIFDEGLGLSRVNSRFAELFRVSEALCVPGTPLIELLRFKAKRGDFGPVDVEILSVPLDRPRQFERPSGELASHELFQPISGGLLVLVTDVTAARQLTLVESRLRKLSKFPEENPGPVLRFAIDGQLSYANRASGPLLARIELKVGEIAPDEWQRWFAEAREARHPIEVEFEREGAHWSLLLCPVDGGDMNMYGRDVTERVRHEIALREAKESADQANVTKSQFLANMSHELRTPMNAIMGFSRLVMRKTKDMIPERQYANLEKILVSAQHLLSLINDILDLSKIEAGRMDVYAEPVDLPALVELCVRTVEPLAAAGVSLESELPEELPLIVTDQAKLKQILINLLSNAVKFTATGSVRVVVRITEAQLEIDVVDSGVGIPEDMRATVFEEFRQVDGSSTREYGGTGLGLAICQKLAGLLGGDITLTSEVGVGSTFSVRVALVHDTAPPQIEHIVAARTGEGVVRSGALILTIDDDDNASYLVKENLAEAGYEVVVAHDGHEGIAKAKLLQPSAITLDIKMAEIDGWQVLHHLKTDPTTRHIPVILLTVVDERPLGYRLGATDYLLKPFDRDTFLASLGRVLHGRGNLLVVDDDPNVHDMVCQMLEQEPVAIRFASNGAEALAAVNAQAPDAIFLDLMMPVMDGFAVIEALRAHPEHQQIPIVVFTAKILSRAEKKLLSDKVMTVFEKKGIDQGALVTEIRQTMQRVREAGV